MNADANSAPLEQFSVGTWRVERWARLGSTSTRARELALAGDPGRVWVLADEQLLGRGREGRAWVSPPGNLYASALIVEPCPVELGAELGFVAGVAALRAVSDLGVAGARLKWPNDLVVDGAKLSGLLVEGVTTPSRRFAAAIGIGINVASSPEGLAYPTTALDRVAGRNIAVGEVFHRLAGRFDEALAIFARGAGFAAIREAWLAAAAGLGGPIRISDRLGEREGRFAGVDTRGQLRLERDGAVELVVAADMALISEPPGATEGAPITTAR